MEEGFVDAGLQGFLLLCIARNIGILTQYLGNLGHHAIAIGQETIVDKVDRGRVLRIDAHRWDPVAQVPTTVFGIRPWLEQSVHLITFGITQPLLHYWIVAFHEAHIAIVHISEPRGRDDETAPVRTTTGGIRIRSGMWHTSVFTLAIAPCLNPVHVQWSKVEEGLSRNSRCITVATITEALDLWAVHDIASQTQVFEGIVNHVINGIHVFVRASERNIRAIIGAYGAGSNVAQRERFLQANQLQVTIALVVELAGEGISCLAIADEIVGIETFTETYTIGQEVIIVVQFHLFAFGYGRHLHIGKAHEVSAHIVDVPTVFVLLCRYRVEGLDALVQFTHLWSGLVSRNIGNDYRSPCQLAQCGGCQIGWGSACIHDFTPHLMRTPSTEGASSTFSRLPSSIGLGKCLYLSRSNHIELGTDIRTARHYR